MSRIWPSTIVARTELEKFTGGAISTKYIANLDSLGRGPSGRFRLGRRIVYPVESVISWLERRAETVESRGDVNPDVRKPNSKDG